MFPVLGALLHAITHTFFLSQLKCHPLLAASPALPGAVPSSLMPLGFSHFSLCGDHLCLCSVGLTCVCPPLYKQRLAQGQNCVEPQKFLLIVIYPHAHFLLALPLVFIY